MCSTLSRDEVTYSGWYKWDRGLNKMILFSCCLIQAHGGGALYPGREEPLCDPYNAERLLYKPWINGLLLVLSFWFIRIPISAAARRVKKKWTPPHGRTKQNHIFLIQWYVGGTKWMVVKKIFEALPWLRRYSNTVSFATLTPFCAHIFQGYEWSWSDKRHVSGISDLGPAKYVAVMITNTSLH